MSEMINPPLDNPASQNPNELMAEMQRILSAYLAENPRRSLNGLSKRCTISEPTLRRLLKGQVKTLPNVTTVLDVLAAVSGEKSVRRIAEIYPGAIARYLEAMAPHFEDQDTQYDPELNLEMRNSTAYLIYKLAANHTGVGRAKVIELFGAQGNQVLENLERKGYIALQDGIYKAVSKNFTGSHGEFVFNFKAVADFIKVRDLSGTTHLDPLLVNYSESISPEAYREIVTIQKAALRKIRAILANPSSTGQVPAFLLMAFDTLDLKTASELVDSSNSH